jgi:hypothetical protein
LGEDNIGYQTLASKKVLDKAINALRDRGVKAEFLLDRAAALNRLRELIPKGASVMTGGSETLIQIGFINLLTSGDHPWKNLKDRILAEKDPAKQVMLRKQSVLSDYFLGSVHAVAQTGELVFASASGSQLPAYVFTGDNVIWVAGTQKLVPTLGEAIKRVREYVLPLEDARMKREGYPGSTIGKLLIFEREIDPNRNLRLLLVGEKLGF